MSQPNVKIEDSWKAVLTNEFQQPYFSALKQILKNEKQEGKTIYPPGPHIFNAFNSTPFKEVKVVILGQDPYHGPNQAHGLSFSVMDGIKPPPSLLNIFRELKTDIGMEVPNSGNLQKWADQGVFLLNASLTVRRGEANSHQKIGWLKFTDAVIRRLSEEREGVVFMLWGGFAKKKAKLIDAEKHFVLTSGHPSPLSANMGHWFGNKHFSKANEILMQQGEPAIDWTL